MLGVTLLIGCRRDAAVGEEDSRFAIDLRESHAALIAAADSGSARRALAAFEALLDAQVAPTAANTAAWLLALTQLEQLELAGWRAGKRAVVHALDRVSVASIAAESAAADRMEAAAVVWLLRRVEAGVADLDAAELQGRLPRRTWHRFAVRDSVDHGWALVLLARASRERGELDDARAALDLTGTTTGARGAESMRIRCFVQLEMASIDQELGRHSDAQHRLESAADALRAEDSSVDAASRSTLAVVVELARVRQAIDLGDWARGRRLAERLVATTRDDSVRAQAEFYRGLAMWSASDRETARPILVASMSSPHLEPKLAAMARLELIGEALDDARHVEAGELLARLGQPRGGEGSAGWPLLDARAQALAARLAVSTAADDAHDRIRTARAAFRAFVDMCARSHDPIGNAPFAFAPRRDLVEDVLELCRIGSSEERGLIAAVEEMMYVRSRGSLTRALGGTAPTLARVRERLVSDSETRLVLLVPGREHTHVFVVAKDTIAHHAGAAPERIADAALELWRDLANPDARRDPQSESRLRVRGEELATRLLGDSLVLDLQRCRRIFLVGAEVLRRLPIEVLVLPSPLAEGGSSPLGLSHEITYLPSVAAGLALLDRARAMPTPATLSAHVLVGQGNAEAGPVVFADRARTRLQRAVPGLRWAKNLSDAAATGDHIAVWFAHGTDDRQRSRPRGLWGVSAGRVPAAAVFADDLESGGFRSSPIHVLAACEGLNTEAKLGGEDVDHLGAVLLRAGALSVLASAAPLEQDATSALIAAIVERVAAGEPIATALRGARRELAASEELRHPHFWATLTLLGLADTTSSVR